MIPCDYSFTFWPSVMPLEPTQVTVEHLTVDVIKHFLTYLEEERGNTIDTRNLRLTALHSFFRFVSRQIPELIEHATQIHNIPYAGLFSPRSRTLRRRKSMPYWRPRIALPYRASVTTLCSCSCTTQGLAPPKRPRPTSERSSSTARLPPCASSGKAARSGSARCGPIPSRSCEVCSVQGLQGATTCRCSSISVVSGSPVSAFTRWSSGRSQRLPHDAIAAAEKSQSAYDSSHHRRRFAPRWGRHEHHTSLARPRLIGDHEPLCASRPGNESEGLGNVCTDARGGQ